MTVRCVALGVAAAALAFGSGYARGDVLHFTDGRLPVEGRVIRRDAESVTIEVTNGRLRFASLDVARIEIRPWAPAATSGTDLAEAAPVGADAVRPPPEGFPAGLPVEPAHAGPTSATIRDGLRADDFEARQEALAALTSLDPAAVGLALDLVTEEALGVDVRVSLLSLLETHRDSDTPLALAVILEQNTAVEVVDQALVVALSLGEDASSLGAQLVSVARSHPASSTRVLAIRAIGATASPEALTAMAEDLAGAPPVERAEIVRALGQEPASLPSVVVALELAVDDPNPEVRRDGVRALSALDPGSATPLHLAQHDPSPIVREAALRSLGARTDLRSQEVLIAALATPAQEAVAGAAHALASRGAESAIPALIAALRSCSGRGAAAVHTALTVITGERLPRTALAWKVWWSGGGRERFGR